MSDSRTVTVNVTQEIINQGIRQSCGACPIAVAMRAAIPDAAIIQAFPSQLTYFRNGTAWSCNTPKVAQQFMVDFDFSRPVSPFQFTAVFERA